jgi:hypothetical protein
MSLASDLGAKKQAMRDAGRGDIIDAHAHCANHREELQSSTIAGCFYCCETFPPSAIDEWIDDGQCAMCPRCGIDSVIGDASGFPIRDKDFLREMNGFWFS